MTAQSAPTAMILAAGLGTRLRPLTDTLPKAMVPVAGRPLVEYALETVTRSKIDRVVINLHHFGDVIRDHVGDGSKFGLEVTYSDEMPLKDSGGGIFQARALLGETTFVTLNADTIMDVDLDQVLETHYERGATATMVLRPDPDSAKFGQIGIDQDARIGAFLEHRRPGACADLEMLMYTGVQVLEPRVFDYMDSSEPFSITRETYPRMLAADEPLFGARFTGTWLTVGSPSELAAAETCLAARRPT